MNATNFDASAFLNEVAATDGFDTSFAPVPEGEYLARVSLEPNDLKIEVIDGKKDPTKRYLRLGIVWDIIDENLKAHLSRDRITVRDQFLLDATFDEAGKPTLETGKEKNVTLGTRRAALHINEGAFRFSDLIGAGPAMIRVKHRTNDGRTYAEVASVVARR